MPMAAAWIGYQKNSGPIIFWMAILLIPVKYVACKIGPSPSDDHAHGDGIEWLSKIFGAEIFWIAILRIPIKTVRMHKLNPNPHDDHAHGSGVDWLSKIFGAEKFWTTIPLIPLKTDRFQDRPKPER